MEEEPAVDESDELEDRSSVAEALSVDEAKSLLEEIALTEPVSLADEEDSLVMVADTLAGALLVEDDELEPLPLPLTKLPLASTL